MSLGVPWWLANLRRLGRFLIAFGVRFQHDECLVRASAVAYVTLLSLVPLFALMFAVLKGLGVQRRLEPLLLSRFALDPEVTRQIIGYIDQTNVATLGALGAAALILTVISVLGSVEGSLNHIWRVPRGRSYWRKLTDYSGVVLLTPLLLLAAVAITSSLQEQSLLQWVLQTQYVGAAAMYGLQFLPVVINTVALAVLYAVMTHRRPYWPGILLGAVVAGTLWHAVQWAYVALQIGMARYGAIYGALSQLPITLVWLYVSALIVLAGAELGAIYEFGPETTRSAGAAGAGVIALSLLIQAADSLRGAGDGVNGTALARRLRVDPAAVAAVADRLIAAGLLAAIAERPSSYVLTREPQQIDLSLIGDLVEVAPVPGCDRRITAILARLEEEHRRAHAHVRLSDVLGLHTDTGANQS
jgi:membrane protein